MSLIARIAQDHEIETCLAVRHEVFVVEQGVPAELEYDEYDPVATHFVVIDDHNEVVGVARLVRRGDSAKIGRVAVLRCARGLGGGRLLMNAVIDEARRREFSEAFLDSQVTVIGFYEKLGFAPEGEIFDDAGIPHRRMRRKLAAEGQSPGEV